MKTPLPVSGARPRRIWAGMKSRCRNKSLKNYGAKGITYDQKWETFTGFWEDMQHGYAHNLSIDRIDSNGNYCKENCRWATAKQQMANYSGNTYLTFRGRTMILSDWARELDISKQSLIVRLRTHKDDETHILTTGRNKAQKFKYLESTKWLTIKKLLETGSTQTEIAKKFGMHQSTISKALSRLYV